MKLSRLDAVRRVAGNCNQNGTGDAVLILEEDNPSKHQASEELGAPY